MSPPRKKHRNLREVAVDSIWPLVQLGGLMLFSWVNATKFDDTELKMLAEYAVFWKITSTLKDRLI
jgi:hypothetical protein